MKTINLNKLSETIMFGFVKLVCLWVVSALCFEIFFVYLQATGQEQRERNIVNKIEWKFDGTFKNNPDNIWYEAPKK
jgi:hypothetical protein